jgi:hypothetical protein
MFMSLSSTNNTACPGGVWKPRGTPKALRSNVNEPLANLSTLSEIAGSGVLIAAIGVAGSLIWSCDSSTSWRGIPAANLRTAPGDWS